MCIGGFFQEEIKREEGAPIKLLTCIPSITRQSGGLVGVAADDDDDKEEEGEGRGMTATTPCLFIGIMCL